MVRSTQAVEQLKFVIMYLVLNNPYIMSIGLNWSIIKFNLYPNPKIHDVRAHDSYVRLR